MSTTVLLADDHDFVRHAIVQFLEAEGANDIQILAQAASYAQTLELASELRPQVILLRHNLISGRKRRRCEFGRA